MSCAPSLHRSSELLGSEAAKRGIDEQHAHPNHRNLGAPFTIGQLQIVLQVMIEGTLTDQAQHKLSETGDQRQHPQARGRSTRAVGEP